MESLHALIMDNYHYSSLRKMLKASEKINVTALN